MRKFTIGRVLSFFLRGLLITAPLFLSIYIFVIVIIWLDGIIPIKIPGLGLLNLLLIITMIGYLATTILAKPLFDWLERAITSLPLVKIVYSSLKDLIEAFVGEKKRFNQPVIVSLDPQGALKRMGFVTQEDLTDLGLEGYVSVYLPHSYNFSGNMIIVARDRVEPVNMKGTDAMKFIVSGGISKTE